MPAISITDLNNAKLDVDHIAEIATSLADTSTDRLGHTKNTISHAIELIDADVLAVSDRADQALSVDIPSAIASLTVINNRGEWVSSTAYTYQDIVSYSGSWYICVVPHTSSGVFATDAATKWRIYQGITTGDLSVAGGARLVGYSQQHTYSDGSVGKKLQEVVSVKDFGAVGDGVTDDTAAIQAALDTGVAIMFPTGIYRTTAEIVLKTGSKIVGSGNFSGFVNSLGGAVAPLNDYTVGTTLIRYDGATSATACVIRAASEAVGVEPTDPNTRNLTNCGVKDVVIDGGGKAGIGLYIVRATSNNTYDNITVTRTTAHGFLILISFIGNCKKWVAYLNEGCGITLGINVFSWVSNNVTVDEIHFDSFFAYYNGHSTLRVPMGQYNKTTNYKKEYGIGFGKGRAVKFTNAQAARNGGVGIYCECDRWPVNFDTFYTEYNCESDTDIPTNGRFGIWVQGVTGGESRHLQFRNGYMSGSTVTLKESDGIRLAGTAPSRTGEDAVIFEQIPLLKHLEAGWSNYRLVDCDSTVTITGTKPNYIPQVVNGQLNMGISGTAAVAVSGAAISSSVCSGNITSVTYTGTGDYHVTFTTNMNTNNYLAIVSGNENRSLAIANKSVSGFDVKSKAISAGEFVASDSATVNILVVGGYTI